MTAKEAATATAIKNYAHIDEDKQFHEIMAKIEKAAASGKNQLTEYFVTSGNRKRFETLGYAMRTEIQAEDGIHTTIFQWWLK